MFFKEGPCVDGSECLYDHSNQGFVTKHSRQQKNKPDITKVCNFCHITFKNGAALEKQMKANHIVLKCEKCKREYLKKK